MAASYGKAAPKSEVRHDDMVMKPVWGGSLYGEAAPYGEAASYGEAA